MGDEFLTGLCGSGGGGGNNAWWNAIRNGTANSPRAVSDIASLFMDPSLPSMDFGLPSPTIDWNDPLLNFRVQSCGGSFLAQPQENLEPPESLLLKQISGVDQNLNSSTQNPAVNGNPSQNPASSRSNQCHEENTSSSSSSSGGKRKQVKKKGDEPAVGKKPRIQMPSPLPTFNVRKEKLQDRVTALQQLVSPFGKTDTASVLYEAIEYIKFLHDQVRVLSAPYLKAARIPMHDQQTNGGPKTDLRSRGLCMVPIASTFGLAQEPVSDFFWATNIGGCYS